MQPSRMYNPECFFCVFSRGDHENKNSIRAKPPVEVTGREDNNFLVDPLLKPRDEKIQKGERSPSAASLVK